MSWEIRIESISNRIENHLHKPIDSLAHSGVPRSTIGNLEVGRFPNPRTATLSRLAQALELSPDYLITPDLAARLPLPNRDTYPWRLYFLTRNRCYVLCYNTDFLPSPTPAASPPTPFFGSPLRSIPRTTEVWGLMLDDALDNYGGLAPHHHFVVIIPSIYRTAGFLGRPRIPRPSEVASIDPTYSRDKSWSPPMLDATFTAVVPLPGIVLMRPSHTPSPIPPREEFWEPGQPLRPLLRPLNPL